VLYTDGIVEAVNAQGEMFGYRRFSMLLQSAWSDDLEDYWKNIMSGYHNWAVNQDDDLTFMMIRRSGEPR